MSLNKASSDTESKFLGSMLPPLPTIDDTFNGKSPIRKKNNSFDESDSTSRIRVNAPEQLINPSIRII